MLAGGAGRKPFSSSRASTKLSRGLRTHVRSLTCGTGGRTTGLNAQKLRAVSSTGGGPCRAFAVPATYGTPILTHLVSTSICAWGSLPLGGILRSSWRRAWSSRLSSGLSSTTTGPLSPPLRIASRLVRRKPPLIFFSPPWQAMQWAVSNGWTCASKNFACSAVGFGSAAACEHQPRPVVRQRATRKMGCSFFGGSIHPSPGEVPSRIAAGGGICHEKPHTFFLAGKDSGELGAPPRLKGRDRHTANGAFSWR